MKNSFKDVLFHYKFLPSYFEEILTNLFSFKRLQYKLHTFPIALNCLHNILFLLQFHHHIQPYDKGFLHESDQKKTYSS